MQRLVQVRDEVVDVLQTDVEANQAAAVRCPMGPLKFKPWDSKAGHTAPTVPDLEKL